MDLGLLEYLKQLSLQILTHLLLGPSHSLSYAFLTHLLVSQKNIRQKIDRMHYIGVYIRL